MACVPDAALQTGLADGQVDCRQAKEGHYDDFALQADSPALVFWAEFFGIEKGDALQLQLTYPNGAEVVRSATGIDRKRASSFSSPASGNPTAVGRPAPIAAKRGLSG